MYRGAQQLVEQGSARTRMVLLLLLRQIKVINGRELFPILKQHRGKTASVSLNQAGVQYTITYQSSGSFENTYFVFNSSATPTGTPIQYRAMMGGGEDFQEIWSPDPGYSVNDVSKGNTRTYLKAGDRVWIRKMTGMGTSWSGSTTQSFTLEANNQTVRLN